MPPLAATALLLVLALDTPGAAPAPPRAPGAEAPAPRLLWPLEAPFEARRLSSSFCEYRGSHFHGGADLSTGGAVGVPVLAAADGEVFRIKVEWRGLGRALYLRHPDGLITVYGHLAGYAPPLRAWVDERLARNPYPGDLWPEPPVKVKGGQVIAWSGETGGGPPHLHFETRRGPGPVDPFAEGLPCPDREPPLIKELRILELPGEPGAALPREVGPIDLAAPDLEPVPLARRRLRLLARVEDPMGAGLGGVRRLEATVRGKPGDAGLALFSLDAAAFDYAWINQVGLVYDRGATTTNPTSFWYWLQRLPGNTLPFVTGLPELDATALGAPGEQAELEIVARDGCGNQARRRVPLRLAAPAPAPAPPSAAAQRPSGATRAEGGRLARGAARLEVRPGTLGEDAALELRALDARDLPHLPRELRLLAGPSAAGPTWLPLLGKAALAFRVPEGAPQPSRLGVYRLAPHRGTWQFWGDDVTGSGEVGTTTDRLGTFVLATDLEAPRLVRSFRRALAGLPWRADGVELVVVYEEEGEGVPRDGGSLRLHGTQEAIRGEHDPDRCEIAFPLPAALRGRPVRATLSLADRAGNAARYELTAKPDPAESRVKGEDAP